MLGAEADALLLPLGAELRTLVSSLSRATAPPAAELGLGAAG